MTPGQEADIPHFGGWAALYRRFRPGYPAAVYQRLRAELHATGQCVELGAGSGQATHCLAGLFQHVIAVEPDARMAALIPAHPCIDVRLARAEEVTLPAAQADAVVAATALHWMDAPAVLRRAHDWLKPGGVFFACTYATAQYPGAPAALAATVQRYAKLWRAHTHERIAHFSSTEALIAAATGFTAPTEFEVYADFRWSAEQVAGCLMSMSYGQAYAQATGAPDDALAAFAADLDAAVGGALIGVRFPIACAFAHRLG